jgi:Rrf2 family protein
MTLKWYHLAMKLLTRNTDYAVRAICAMAKKPGEVVSAAHLVKDLRIPRPFLRKILQTLGKKGIVDSAKGVGGGFRLALDPGKIYLADIIEAFQGPIKVNECMFKKKICPNRGQCPLKKKIDQIEDHVVSELQSVTIGSLLGKG